MLSRANRGGKRADFAQIAASVVEQAIGEVLKPAGAKNGQAVALGRLGGLKGRTARKPELSKTKRSVIASEAGNPRRQKYRETGS